MGKDDSLDKIFCCQVKNLYNKLKESEEHINKKQKLSDEEESPNLEDTILEYTIKIFI